VIGRDSRYSSVPTVTLVDSQGNALENTRLDIPYPRPPAAMTPSSFVTRYSVRGDDTWRSLGHRFFFGRAGLSWAIMECSCVIDPFLELGPGKTTPGARGTLLIPSFDEVMLTYVEG
jgi:hypothetical protein